MSTLLQEFLQRMIFLYSSGIRDSNFVLIVQNIRYIIIFVLPISSKDKQGKRRIPAQKGRKINLVNSLY